MFDQADKESRALCVFLRTSQNQQTVEKNRLIALDYLRQLSTSNELCLQETCILAFGHMAR